MEKQQNNSEQIGALQTELQQLTERLEKVQIESQDKSDVSHINKNFMIFDSPKKIHLMAICPPLLDITQVPVKFGRHKTKYPQWKSDCCMRQKFKRPEISDKVNCLCPCHSSCYIKLMIVK